MKPFALMLVGGWVALVFAIQPRYQTPYSHQTVFHETTMLDVNSIPKLEEGGAYDVSVYSTKTTIGYLQELDQRLWPGPTVEVDSLTPWNTYSCPANHSCAVVYLPLAPSSFDLTP